MIDPRRQWAIQIDVTNLCCRECSNCTRLLAHIAQPFFMSVECFIKAVEALRDFPRHSLPNETTPSHKIVGMIGGEPLLHPEFEQLCAIMVQAIPDREHRGLWTGLVWQQTKYAAIIEKTFGYINNNLHNSECLHSPILVAIGDVIRDPHERQSTISHCWLQEKWSGSITPKGFFFCEVAAAFDMVMNGPGGLPIESGCWNRPLADFQEQIDRWCPRCGIAMNLQGRCDSEHIDDMSESNLNVLQNSPRVQAGDYVLYDPSQHVVAAQPWRYMQ
jgi:hypothetical protein